MLKTISRFVPVPDASADTCVCNEQFARISNASGITGTTDDFIRKKSDYYGSSQVTKTEHQSNTLCEALKLRREIKSQIEDEKIQTNGEHTMT